ncbi:MAG TPA: hypothetical protein VFM98_10515 [Ramlibacter sp.]|uniref:hypothetical protein n=1 Tax=Ramlibacter sp. TaxID=1917967 RepID=UPI002D80AC83|nr:hypothetical protein [Ramlibacter sp.]HET8746029.1 hypothetical protein [Ramlibacter sp.]
MKKYIAMAVAAGALGVGGAASAQDFGTVIGNLFGFGQPTYTYPSYGRDIPAVVAGTVPYGSTNRVFIDQYGRQVYIDAYGRQVLAQPSTPYGVTGYDAWGRPIYGNVALADPNDRDRDGMPNYRDRWPDDSRYW